MFKEFPDSITYWLFFLFPCARFLRWTPIDTMATQCLIPGAHIEHVMKFPVSDRLIYYQYSVSDVIVFTEILGVVLVLVDTYTLWCYYLDKNVSLSVLLFWEIENLKHCAINMQSCDLSYLLGQGWEDMVYLEDFESVLVKS